jgi:hypothetical protein
MIDNKKIAIVSFLKIRTHILQVIKGIRPEVDVI